jgi:putative transposase
VEVTTTMGAAEVLPKYLLDADPDLIRSTVKTFAQALMSAEAWGPVQWRGQPRAGELAQRRSRRWDTRAGTIDLAIPNLSSGSYFPDWLIEPHRHAQLWLVAALLITAKLIDWCNRWSPGSCPIR